MRDLEIVGGHVHARLTDPSGFQATAAEALDALEAAGAHGVVFAVSDPARYREANDAVLNLVGASAPAGTQDGSSRTIPFTGSSRSGV